MEKLRKVVVLSSPFEHSSELEASHRVFEPGSGGKAQKGFGHSTKRSERAQSKAFREFEGKFRGIIDQIAEDKTAHLVLRNVSNQQLREYAKSKISGRRLSEVEDMEYAWELMERVRGLGREELTKLTIVGMGEYASLCVTGGVLETLSHIYSHRKVAIPLKNAHVDLERSFLHDDFVDENMRHLTLPELEHRIGEEKQSFIDSIMEMKGMGEISLPTKQIIQMLDDPHTLLPKVQFDAIRKRHRELRMGELRKMARKWGWTEEDFSHKDSEKVLESILQGTFQAEEKAHTESPVRLDSYETGSMENIAAKNTSVRKRLRSAGRKYMRGMLKKSRPAA